MLAIATRGIWLEHFHWRKAVRCGIKARVCMERSAHGLDLSGFSPRRLHPQGVRHPALPAPHHHLFHRHLPLRVSHLRGSRVGVIFVGPGSGSPGGSRVGVSWWVQGRGLSGGSRVRVSLVGLW